MSRQRRSSAVGVCILRWYRAGLHGSEPIAREVRFEVLGSGGTVARAFSRKIAEPFGANSQALPPINIYV